MSAANGTWPEKMVFTGQPELVALKYGTGKQFPSQRPGAPDSVLFSLTDGRNMWVPIKVADRIDQLGLAIGESFEICRHPRDRWTVRKASGAMRPDPARVERAGARDVAPTPIAKQMETPNATAPMNGAGATHADILAGCYSRAIDIALAAVELAKSKGLMIAPVFEDIRCIANCICMGETRR